MSGMGKQTAHNSQLLCRFRFIPMQINSVINRLSNPTTYNWLVVSNQTATISNCWKLLTASIPTPISKEMEGTRINDHGRNNIEDWMISSQASKLDKHASTKKVQRLDDIGLSSKLDLRYSPFLNESSYNCGSGLLKLDANTIFFRHPKLQNIIETYSMILLITQQE